MSVSININGILDLTVTTSGITSSSQCTATLGSTLTTPTIKDCTTINCTTVNCKTINCSYDSLCSSNCDCVSDCKD